MTAGHPVDSPTDNNAPAPAQPSARAEPLPARCIASEQLFQGATEVQIDHHGVLYRLRKTSLGKLILTK